MPQFLDQFILTVYREQTPTEKKSADLIKVSNTVSAAASIYENIRNTLEYDEEHRLRRNAIRRFFKRRFGEENYKKMSSDLLHELIWAKYLPNNEVPSDVIGEVSDIIEKYQPLFDIIDESDRDYKDINLWLIDMMSTEIEYHLTPPTVQEALASLAYQDLKERIEWSAPTIKPEDRDLQLYIAVHRSLLKSNQSTLRYRVFTLYYPEWTGEPTYQQIIDIANNLRTIIQSVEVQISHPASDRLFRFAQKSAIVYNILHDIVADEPESFKEMLQDEKAFHVKVAKAAANRYNKFRSRLLRVIIRAALFLFFTKMILALIVELPYDVFVVQTTNFTPLITNIMFPPVLLLIIGMSARSLPERKNTSEIQKELEMVVGKEKPAKRKFTMKKPRKKSVQRIFNFLYLATFAFSIVVISSLLASVHFNILSIVFFIFFLSLVMYFGLRIRGTRKELVIIEGAGTVFSTIGDIFFLPIVRTGRWMSMRAPRINVILFFLDFIIEAPFKAAIKMIEGWLAFLREKKEEI